MNENATAPWLSTVVLDSVNYTTRTPKVNFAGKKCEAADNKLLAIGNSYSSCSRAAETNARRAGNTACTLIIPSLHL